MAPGAEGVDERTVPPGTPRAITGYHRDEVGDWVAELSCGHNQHVRHRPPFQLRPWVLDAAGRAARIGAPLHCPLCDRAELPETVQLARETPVWDEQTMPAGLRRAHRVAAATWGEIVVRAGHLRFRAATFPPIDVQLGPGATQPIPPEIEHEVEPLGPVRFSVRFLAVHREPAAPEVDEHEDASGAAGGDPACWAGLLCPECGAVISDGYHRAGCPAATTAGRPTAG